MNKAHMDNELTSLYEIRDYKDEDKAFIMATFLRGLYYGDSWYSLIDKDVFMYNYKNFLETLLARPSTIIKVAVLKDDPDVILGYSVLGHNYQTIHWVFVKKAWRKSGIGRSLVPQWPTTVTHLTALGRSLLTKFENCKFNPFAIN